MGWNLLAVGPPDLCRLSGSFIPFAKTRAERLQSGDSRKSLEERCGTHDGFVRAVESATQELVEERFLLKEDARALVDAARSSDVLR